MYNHLSTHIYTTNLGRDTLPICTALELFQIYTRSSVAQPSAVLGSVSTMIDMEPTAGDLHGARLGVQGVQLQVHGAGERQGHADTEQHSA